jgi:molybdopterin converting factor small subunit
LKSLVTFEISKMLSAYADGRTTIEVSGTSVLECIEGILHLFPQLKPEILADDANLLPRWLLLINENIVHHEPLQHPVVDGDVLKLIPVIAGG